MLETEQRVYPRFEPKGVLANISIEVPPSKQAQFVAEGEVIDLSYNGVKVRLKRPLKTEVGQCGIKIEIIMPRTTTPICLHGIIKHIKKQCEYGLQFTDQDPETNIDDLMFECLKLANKSAQI